MDLPRFDADARSVPPTFIMTRPQYHALCKRTYSRGMEDGLFFGRRQARDELAEEIRAEMDPFDPACPLCVAQRELAALGHRLAVEIARSSDARSRGRGWTIRTGRRTYRETRAR